MKIPTSPFDHPKRMAIMVLLERHHCIIFSELYSTLKLTRGSVDSHLKKFEELEYITREVKFVRTRSEILVCPTQAGLDALQKAKKIWMQMLQGDIE